MAGITGERSVVVEAPQDDVFRYVSDFSRHTEWNHQIVEIIKDTDGPVGVGTRFRAREQPPSTVPLPMKLMFPLMLRMVGMDKYTVAEITEWEPNERIAWKAEAPLKNGGLWMWTEWSIEVKQHDEGTMLTQRYRYVPEHERAKKGLSDPEKADQMIGGEVSRNLEQLKQNLESSVAHTRTESELARD